MSSADTPLSHSSKDSSFTVEAQRILFRVPELSIAKKVATGRELEIDTLAYPALLRELRATFVTLRINGNLRGCMGSLNVSDPLVVDVALNAAAAASRDPRFRPVAAEEIPNLDIHLSILSRAKPIAASSEEELIRAIRVGTDGLILHEGSKRSTLLPAVWEHVAAPREFLRHLKHKAGLPADYWSDTIHFDRYTAESLHKPVD